MHSIEPVPLPHDGPPDILLWRLDFVFDVPMDAGAFGFPSNHEREQ
ncbi:hypothetical protein [Paraburkholderia strydomiana]|jgi:4'-phosphopantetheinyl transferase